MENQYELMKNLISNTERKILGEFERKLRNETVIKDYIEDKIAELKEEIVRICYNAGNGSERNVVKGE